MKNNEITLEGSIATWKMPLTQGSLGGSYTGTFTFKTFLDPLTQLQAGRELRELIGSLGNQASEVEWSLAYALTQLKHRVLTSPPFWTSTQQSSGISGNVGDLNIIELVIAAAMLSEQMFKEKIEKDREDTLTSTIKTVEETLKKEKE